MYVCSASILLLYAPRSMAVEDEVQTSSLVEDVGKR